MNWQDSVLASQPNRHDNDGDGEDEIMVIGIDFGTT
jgi:hypothetical protein